MSGQSARTSNGYGTETYYSAITNGDDYDSGASSFNFPMTLSNSIPAELAGAIPLIDKFQVEGFLRAMQIQINSAGKHGFEPIPTSLLKINGDFVSRAVKLFKTILKYMGIDSSEKGNQVGLEERIQLVSKLYKQALKRSELRDEIFAQISKQTRNCPDRQYLIRAWELMYMCASCMPPSEDIGGYISEYIHDVVHNHNTDSDVQVLAMNTLNALKCSLKTGPRHTIPCREEIEALLVGKKLTTTVFFFDETFEEISYDMATTVSNAVEELAGIIKLSAYSSLSLFKYRKLLEPENEEYIELNGNTYIGDVLAESKSAKDQCKLIFRKKFFRESDEAIADPVFVQLSYVQLQHHYILGNYPVAKDDAAQLSALQILVEIGYVVKPETRTDWTLLLERFLPRQIAITRAKRDWELDILKRYRSIENLTKEDARQQFLRVLRMLPYGYSVFFSVRKIDDPFGLLPESIILSINKRGVHFFRPVPKEYLHSAELRDIMQFGSSHTSMFFKMRFAGVLQIFQFETKSMYNGVNVVMMWIVRWRFVVVKKVWVFVKNLESDVVLMWQFVKGEEICVVLQTHINDVMSCRYSKPRSAANSGPINGDISSTSNSRPPNVDAGKIREHYLLNALKESQETAKQLSEELYEKERKDIIMQKEVKTLKDTLNSERLHWSINRTRKDTEARLSQLSIVKMENNTKKELIETTNQVLQNIQDQLRTLSSELHAGGQ
ncbi:kinesin-like protein KIN-14E [Bidens hawaiensis]|uniref:kinesin-like protein KIN-14E n=1 Tax=Bidens hawaiensis TaxID=980011 RepID=UPI00404B9490